jgi:hypothetical protein
MPKSHDSSNTKQQDPGNSKFIVVAGPGTSLTIPGVIVSEIVTALAKSSPVRRIEVDLGIHPTMGLHRAPSLTAVHEAERNFDVQRRLAPRNTRARLRVFRQLVGPDAGLAVAYAWPGIDNHWIHEYLRVAKDNGVRTVVLCATLPPSREVRSVSLVDTLRHADLVLVGDRSESQELEAAFGHDGPEVLTHRALSLASRRYRSGPQKFSAFLPSNGSEALTALMGAFDAIPDSKVNDYKLQVITRFESSAARSIVTESHHARHVQLFSEEMTKNDLGQLCETSSALSVFDPPADSRAFSAAVNFGVATVVLASANSVPVVGRGYVGGLMADGSHPASIYVAMKHALRLSELGFPNPDAWRELAEGIIERPLAARAPRTIKASRYLNTPSIKRFPELMHFCAPAIETEWK